MRDFMWIEDTVDVILWLMQHPEISGLFNVGTGQARTYADVLRAVYAALDENRKWTLWICRPKSKGSINILPRPIFKNSERRDIRNLLLRWKTAWQNISGSIWNPLIRTDNRGKK